jgi:hypothetical protein
MAQSISNREAAATSSATKWLDQVCQVMRDALSDALTATLSENVTPGSFADLEQELAGVLRDVGRQFLERIVNEMETGEMQRMVVRHGLIYRRLKKRTRNQRVSTLFGDITVQRFGYRHCDDKHCPEPCIFPLELRLGLVQGVTPALGSRIGKQMARTTQQQTIHWLREEHGVRIGAGRLRKFIAKLSSLMSEQRHSLQVQALLDALSEANRSPGGRKPVLAVGRDGVTMCENHHSFWEVATVATVTVFDRQGKRLLTVYLAHSPQLGQAAISQQLTALITDVLGQWTGPLPTLAYIADSGGKESSYFEDELRCMTHPRTHVQLKWQRVVDYYHAAERVWTAAEALFGKRSNKHWQWAQRMLKLLKQPNGPKRLLHSAAAHASVLKLGKTRREKLEKALNYIRRRTPWMQYAEYRTRHIPIGSGITEAGCKTIFTQRLKQSGMRWSKQGADVILTLRVVLLSGIWNAAYGRVLNQLKGEIPATYRQRSETPLRSAA